MVITQMFHEGEKIFPVLKMAGVGRLIILLWISYSPSTELNNMNLQDSRLNL